jgi:hypothetical protein
MGNNVCLNGSYAERRSKRGKKISNLPQHERGIVFKPHGIPVDLTEH